MKFTASLVAAVATAALSVPAVARVAPPGIESVRQGPVCQGAKQSLDEAGFVRIGGIPQWITINGASCANPVILMIHGGPGNPNSPFASRIYGGWSSDFTVVQWDQRGAGKTYGSSRPSDDDPLTLDQMTRDGVEVARYLTRRLGKQRVILMGSSWGSALAVHMIKAEPTLFHAYVGTGQLVAQDQNFKASYSRVLTTAGSAKDQDTVGKLEAIGRPPWTDPRAFGVLRRATRKYEALVTDRAPKEWWRPAPGYDSPAYEADYEAGEDYSYLQFVGLAGNGLASRLDLYKLGTDFEIPMFFLQGEQDLVTTSDVAKAYFDKLNAPEKALILLPRTGHDPNATMVEMQLETLKKHVRAKAISNDRR